MKKNIMVLGSTGSIGTQTLDVVRRNKDINIVSLAAGGNIDLLEQQIIEFAPEAACVYQEDKALELKKRLKGGKTEILTGMDGMVACATVPSGDMVVASVVGMIGILPVIEAVKAKKDIAFANKETLVTAGHIIMPLVREMGVNMLPVDSEHAAVFQCLNGERHGDIRKIILTASGGPFRGKSLKDLENVSVEDALKHPNWSMGKKITVDSSTMVNKGLEVIEARWLFDVPFEQIEVVVQPQSIIHSMVEFMDGAVMAQLGTPDMRLPIQYALCYPERRERIGEPLDFTRLTGITFEQPDLRTFRGLALAYEAGKAGGSMPTVFNAANEKAVSLFLQGKVPYLTMADMIEDAMDAHTVKANPDIDEILGIERDVCSYLDRKYGRHGGLI
ncbi:1-deoxy-D-xylulose-5-phosphate reductoisomerase [bacterium 1xD8-6]|nr:1-deoxy-D-xylulose-5-phosphate reductoisomerase [bacterium D16-36]RKI68338.1 1-deoxy-D-xylulose-5-phosphate reductoisomerase [bacterium 1xD8-6]